MAPAAERTIELRDGTRIDIRSARSTDLPQVRELELAVHEAAAGTALTAQEMSAAHPAGLPRRMPEGDAGRSLVAVVDDLVVGSAVLRRGGGALLRHGAMLTIGVHPHHQARGIGGALLDALLEWADTPTSHLARVELQVRADNHHAIALYESRGFAREGRRQRSLRLPNGDFVDDLLMARLPDAAPEVLCVDHVQLLCPPGGEPAARSYWSGIVRLQEVPKPERLAATGGVWFRCGDQGLHIGIEHDFSPSVRAHPAIRLRGVAAFEQLAGRLERAGHAVEHAAQPIAHRRMKTRDPFGNLIEFVVGSTG